MFHFQDIQHSELRSYFKSEYKTDWEFEYQQFLDQRKQSRGSVWSRLKSYLKKERTSDLGASVSTNPAV